MRTSLVAVTALALIYCTVPAEAARSSHHYRCAHQSEAGSRQQSCGRTVRHLHRHHATRRHPIQAIHKPRKNAALSEAADSPRWLSEARRYLGGNPTGWAHNWCARFIGLVLARVGLPIADDRAISYAGYGRQVEPRRGALAILQHHIGIVLNVSGRTVTMLSGNYGHRVAIGHYDRGRIIGYRWPTGRASAAALSPFIRIG